MLLLFFCCEEEEEETKDVLCILLFALLLHCFQLNFNNDDEIVTFYDYTCAISYFKIIR